MAQATIPVDLFNPGQVFACMGFLEAAEVLLGHAEGGFDWSEAGESRFSLVARGSGNPIEGVLEFLATAEIERFAPANYEDDAPNDGPLVRAATFPSPAPDGKTLPVRLSRGCTRLTISHWCDGSSRNPFKLFSGNQRAPDIARRLVSELRRLWAERAEELLADPFGVVTPIDGGSFRMDARNTWTTIDAGYSPDQQNNDVEVSPALEILAAVGLENGRPEAFADREMRYGVWSGLLRPSLARPALGGAWPGAPIRVFRFALHLAGRNRNVTFAREEI